MFYLGMVCFKLYIVLDYIYCIYIIYLGFCGGLFYILGLVINNSND